VSPSAPPVVVPVRASVAGGGFFGVFGFFKKIWYGVFSIFIIRGIIPFLGQLQADIAGHTLPAQIWIVFIKLFGVLLSRSIFADVTITQVLENFKPLLQSVPEQMVNVGSLTRLGWTFDLVVGSITILFVFFGVRIPFTGMKIGILPVVDRITGFPNLGTMFISFYIYMVSMGYFATNFMQIPIPYYPLSGLYHFLTALVQHPEVFV
jgi:hypothetical protein